jgi:DNA topoisomerase I
VKCCWVGSLGAVTGLRFVTDDMPGIRRSGRTRFRYVDQQTGEPVQDPDVLARIRSLAVPPAWTDVWICTDESGHLQATGRDSRNRKVYRYHPAYREEREAAKFDQLVPFGSVLGDLRGALDDDLRRRGLPLERVAALVVTLIEHTFVRVGNEEYARDNRTFGLTTLRDRHAKVNGSEVEFTFKGKGAKVWAVGVDNRRLARLVRRCQDLPGQVLFQYQDEDGRPTPITSTEVNEYLRERSGLDLTAKTFRTWGGTLLTASELVEVDRPASQQARRRVVNDVVGMAADVLGNTVAVCKRSYVHPTVLEAFEDGSLLDRWSAGPARDGYGLSSDERRLLHLLGPG